MGIVRRIIQFLRMLLSLLVEGLEETVPLERRLAYDREQHAVKVRGMMDAATDVGEAAEMMVQGLAEARIIEANLREEIRSRLQSAKAAASRDDTATEESEQAAAAALADDLAEAEAEVLELELTVAEALKDQKEAKQMVVDQVRELERLSRNDARLVAKVRRTEMKQEALHLREAMLQLIPEDREDIRRRALEQAKKREARVKARTELVDALWKEKRRRVVDRRLQVSARGAQILRQMEKEVGYVPSTAAPEPIEATTVEELKEKVAAAQE